tara:strand:+ start:711 stop:965 length:255 start_codon:yes stop_codon:yes gene_type:complete
MTHKEVAERVREGSILKLTEKGNGSITIMMVEKIIERNKDGYYARTMIAFVFHILYRSSKVEFDSNKAQIQEENDMWKWELVQE